MPRTPFDITIAGVCNYSNPDGSNPVSSVVPAYRASETAVGVSRRKPSGFIPPTPYNLLFRSVTNAHGSCLNKHKTVGTFGQLFKGVVGGGTGVAGRFSSADHFDSTMSEAQAVDANCANQALIRARNKLKQTSVNLGVAFGERNATARLIGDTATRLARSYRHLRRGRIRDAMDTLGITSARREPRGSNAPQKWLELQYGWKPLLSDVYGAADALSKRNAGDWSVTAVGRFKSTRKFAKTFASFDAGEMAAESVCSAYCRIDALPDNEAIISLASLGITNPLLIGWELVPFSFVVDWFLPVGSYLEGLDALLGYSKFSYSNSVLTRASWDGKGVTLPPSGSFQIINDYVENKRIVRLDRSASADVPFPRFPRFKDPRSLEHMANGLSLLATVFGRH